MATSPTLWRMLKPSPAFQMVMDPAYPKVIYWGTKAHYVPPTDYVVQSWEPGPSDCEWIVPGTEGERACRTFRLIL
jgi:hypothetical protein